MFQSPYVGQLEVICGCMFSGKTEELLRRLKRAQIAKQKVQVFKPKIDNRYSENHVQSHDASRLLSIPIENSSEILNYLEDNTRVVGIDEIQFFDSAIIEIAQKLTFRGIRVIVAGLDMDYKSEPFGPIPILLSVAESITKLNAVCTVCGGFATRTQRISLPKESSGKEQIVVGAHDLYEARCRLHHEPHQLGIPAYQFGMHSQPIQHKENVREKR